MDSSSDEDDLMVAAVATLGVALEQYAQVTINVVYICKF